MKYVTVSVKFVVPEQTAKDRDEFGKDLFDMWTSPVPWCPHVGINKQYITETVEDCLTNDHHGITTFEGAKVLEVTINDL